jgi:steroid delta-isomerase
MHPEDVQYRIDAYIDAINALDVDAYVACFAPDALLFDPADSLPMEGHEGVRMFFLTVAGLFESIEFQKEQVFICANEAAMKFRAQGVGKNGRRVSFEGIDVFSLNEEGTIQDLRGYWNPLPVITQLQM